MRVENGWSKTPSEYSYTLAVPSNKVFSWDIG